MVLLVVLFRHTAGWFPFRHRAQVRAPNQPAPEVIQNQQNQDQDGQPEPVRDPILVNHKCDLKYWPALFLRKFVGIRPLLTTIFIIDSLVHYNLD